MTATISNVFKKKILLDLDSDLNKTANSYYIGLMLSGEKGEAQQSAAKKVGLHFPNQNGRGTHINISGAGIIKYTKNKENAERFIEFLLSKKAKKKSQNSMVRRT